MADGISGSDIGKWIGAPIFGGLVGFATWLSAGTPYGPALAALISVLLAVFGLAIALYFDRTVGVLGAGAEPEGSPERQAYDRLRASLVEGNLPERLYAKWLEIVLHRVELFFGDAGMANRTLFPHFFGLRTAAPLWTAPAFDRCLLLALIYPIVVIFGVWAIIGHVGPAERVLGLPPDFHILERLFFVASLAVMAFCSWKSVRSRGWLRKFLWAIAFAIAFSGAGAGAVVFAGAFAGAGASGLAGAGVLAGAVAGAVTIASAGVVAIAVAGGVAVAVTVAITITIDIAIAFPFAFSVTLLNKTATKKGYQGIFLLLFSTMMLFLCFIDALFLSSWDDFWVSISGPLLLFLGLLTFLNAPFDWASLGLTRALLWRGLELKGWWPYGFAVLDAALAAGIITILAFVMVLGVQTFNELARLGAGPDAVFLPVSALLDGIAEDPWAPEYWWLYALLLSTMIPSLVNLVIGGMALTRGIPGLSSLLLNFMTVGKAVPTFDRAWMAALLSVQVFGGICLGISAQFLLAWVLLFHLMPWAGLNLLDLARAVEAFDLPARIGAAFVGIW